MRDFYEHQEWADDGIEVHADLLEDTNEWRMRAWLQSDLEKCDEPGECPPIEEERIYAGFEDVESTWAIDAMNRLGKRVKAGELSTA